MREGERERGRGERGEGRGERGEGRGGGMARERERESIEEEYRGRALRGR